MPNWKELGEVPDSEDDDAFDSQGSLQSTTAPDALLESAAENLDDRVWDVPSSQEEDPLNAGHEQTRTPNTTISTLRGKTDARKHKIPNDVWELSSSPIDELANEVGESYLPTLRAAPSQVLGDSIWDVPSTPDSEDADATLRPASRHAATSTNGAVPQDHPSSSPLSSIDSIIFEDLAQDAQFEQQGSQQVASSVSDPSVPRPQAPPPTQAEASHDTADVSLLSPARAAQQTALRYERSLRARKPIQEHPFLLEMAQYNTVMKSHGMKPVRWHNQAEATKPAQATLGSQDDKEYSEPESQESIAADRARDPFGDETLDLLMSSPLSLPSAHVPVRYDHPESHPAIDRAPFAFPNDVDELPVIQEPDRPMASVRKRPVKRAAASPRTSSTQKKRRQAAHVDSESMLHERRSLSPSLGQEPEQMPFSSSPIPDLAKLVEMRRQPKENSPQPTTVTPSETTLSSDQRHGVSIETGIGTIELGESDSDAETVVTELPRRRPTVDDSSESGSGPSDGDQNIVHSVKRRIRGVLPASWLRLDQKSGVAIARKDVLNRIGQESPEQQPKRGVAVVKKKAGRPSASGNDLFWFDDSDDEHGTAQLPTTDEAFHRQTTLDLNRQTPTKPVELDDSDDNIIDITREEPEIDRMLASRVRQKKPSATPLRKASTSRKPASASRPRPRVSLGQPTIRDALGLQRSSTSLSDGVRRAGQKAARGQNGGRKLHRASGGSARRAAPPRLGILDVIQPDAPKFLKIAARTARRRQDKGRSSPRQKSFHFATREDQIDAMVVVQKWTDGSIQQRHLPTTGPISNPRTAASARAQSSNPSAAAGAQQDNPKPVESRDSMNTVKGRGSKNLVVRRNHKDMPQSQAVSKPGRQGVTRPAQLEVSEGQGAESRSFYSWKRTVDRLFRQSCIAPPSLHSIRDTNGSDDAMRIDPPPQEPHQRTVPQASSRDRSKPAKSRYRKQRKPVHVDVEAPQYKHAQDPIPARDFLPEPVTTVQTARPSKSKLQGLGPYGTHYTHHFDTFPMHPEVYFHESTLVGSGIFSVISHDAVGSSRTASADPASFLLGDQLLQWGPWTAQVSSELGILMDSMAESAEIHSVEHHNSTCAGERAADFLLSYIRRHLSFHQQSDLLLFITRFQEVLVGFTSKVSPDISSAVSSHSPAWEQIQRIMERLLVATLSVLCFCRREPSLASEQYHVEDALKALANAAINLLVKRGLARLRDTYKEQGLRRSRERGLREDCPLHTWVVVMKTVEKANIPRASFWDMVQTHISSPATLASKNVVQLDMVWENMFSLLPLADFNDRGLIDVHGRRRELQDGWSLPQKLLKPVFELYQEDARQAPSFNHYCRALVARCHWLVEQWGWRRTLPIVGMIFDFFGTQRLGNLRNEEVYKSPDFLESLSDKSTLQIEPEDRCFHLFLKLLGLSIRLLGEIDASKDIRNLVTRTIPNHARVHSKDHDFDERELAALRNHHDLLCTLFWACPPDLRPSPSLLENLVDPATSHKEACIVNIRAWSQLARFIVTNGEAVSSIKPLNKWRHSFFDQAFRQHTLVASDVNQQLFALPKEERLGISQLFIDQTIATNKSQTEEVLRLTMVASCEVLKQCPDLSAATFAWSPVQLQTIFNQFTTAPFEMSLDILDVALQTLTEFLMRIEAFRAEEESQGGESQELDSAQASDALETLEHYVTKSFFSMARCLLASSAGDEAQSDRHSLQQNARMEMVITLAAKISWLSGTVSDLFKQGRYGLFAPRLIDLSRSQSEAVVLCVAILLKMGLDDLVGMDFSLLDLWAVSLVKPQQASGWLDMLARELRRMGKEFMPDAAVCSASAYDYQTNRDRFECVLLCMRKSLRDAGPNLRKILLSEHKKTITMVMDQMPHDLAALSSDPVQHATFMSHVQQIISLVKSHASDFCAVHDFYYQTSRYYAPPAQDPQLQNATMEAYGLHLKESGANDAAAATRFSYFLINMIKEAYANRRVNVAVDRIRQSMEMPTIRKFIVSTMLPAALQASITAPLSFLVAEAFLKATFHFFQAPDFPPVLQSADDMHVLFLVARDVIQFILPLSENAYTDSDIMSPDVDGFLTGNGDRVDSMELDNAPGLDAGLDPGIPHPYDTFKSLGLERLCLLEQAARALNLLRPSLLSAIMSQERDWMNWNVSPDEALASIKLPIKTVDHCARYHLSKHPDGSHTFDCSVATADEADNQAAMNASQRMDENAFAHVTSIASRIVQDVRSNWEAERSGISSGPFIFRIKMPGQPKQDLEWALGDIYGNLSAEAQAWETWYDCWLGEG